MDRISHTDTRYARNTFYMKSSIVFPKATRLPEHFILVGKKGEKTFDLIGGDEDYDPEHGECMAYLYVSECRQFEARLLIV